MRSGIISFNFKFCKKTTIKVSNSLQLDSALFGLLLLFFQFKLNLIFILTSTLFLVPQIVHNALRSQRAEGKQYHLYLLVASKMTILVSCYFLLLFITFDDIKMYFKGCPYNFTELRPTLTFPLVLIVSTLIQVI